MQTAVVDAKTGRKCYLDVPSRLAPAEEVTFVLSLHGGGSAGTGSGSTSRPVTTWISTAWS